MSGLPTDPAQIQAFIESKKREVAKQLQRIQQANAANAGATEAASRQQPAPMAGVTSTATTGVSSGSASSSRAETRTHTTRSSQASLYSTQLGEKRGGLAGPVHPLIEQLTGGSGMSGSSKRMHPLQGNIPKASFATIKANQRGKELKKEIRLLDAPADFSDPNKNPHFDPNLTTSGAKHRGRRQFNFVGHGTYIRQAEKIRTEAQMEELRRNIALSAEKAGMEVELDIATDKQIRGDPPPEVEWWDEPLLANRTYNDIDEGQLLLTGEGSAITQYVQHPVPIPGPQDLKAPVARPLMLTTKEQKKLRRQRRLEVLKEKQDKVRLGLLPPDPPKVKMSNLMRVLGNEAIQDPTKMEAYVRNEMRKRQDAHMKANEERKLTDEERREKRQRKLNEDAAKGIEVLVFRINSLTHPQKKFKVETNANQLGLTGAAIISSRFSVVIVEGGPKSIRTYKKLMLRRIKWSDSESEHDNVNLSDNEAMDTDAVGGQQQQQQQQPNRCVLVWEGRTRGRTFRSFRFRRCPTEGVAKEFLSHHRADHYWDIARNIKEEDLLADSNQPDS